MTSEIFGDDSYFKRHIAELGDTRAIVASRDIYSASGIKLLNAGFRINSSVYENILRHKLLPPIEQSLEIENSVTPEILAMDCKELISKEPLLAILQDSFAKTRSLCEVVGRIKLNQVISLKLTVAKDRLPDLYGHSLTVALICAFLGLRSKLNKTQLVDLATAGLFHDLGELHIDPAILDRKKKLDEAQMKHIVAHPVTTYMMLQEFPEYTKTVGYAILEHHERLDGSGYPLGTRTISDLGRMLAVAELVAGLYRAWGEAGLSRIQIILKLNMRNQLDGKSVSQVLSVLQAEVERQNIPLNVDMEKLRIILQSISNYFNYCDVAFKDAMAANNQNLAVIFTAHQTAMLQRSMADVGFNREYLDGLANTLEGNSIEANELQVMAHEFIWRLRDIMHEVQRRWPSLSSGGDDSSIALIDEWRRQSGEVIFQLEIEHGT